MHITTRPLSQVERQVAERLASHEFRFTAARRLIVEALSRSQGPRSAAELAEATEHSVPLSSLYRNLSVLEEVGVAAPHHGPGGRTRYELSEWLSGHHHHLVCTRCGRVEDVELDSHREATLEAVVHAAGAATGFLPEGHTLEIEGVCPSCASGAAS